MPDTEDPPSPFTASPHEVGQTLEITGRYYTPDLAVTISAYPGERCLGETFAVATVDTVADAEGQIETDFYLDPENSGGPAGGRSAPWTEPAIAHE